MSLQWDDIDFKWKRISIMGKGCVPRDIPMIPYIASLLFSLPRVNNLGVLCQNQRHSTLTEPDQGISKDDGTGGD
jgi:integrase